MQSLTLKEAADFLKMHPEEVRRRAKAGRLPGAKPGKSWVFLDDDLASFVRSHYASERQALLLISAKEKDTCHFLNGARRGGSTSPRQQASELDALLEQMLKAKRRNITTG